VNRHTTGARVAIEPFGGFKFSGTGPKAGGSDYLWAFVTRTDHAEPASPQGVVLSVSLEQAAATLEQLDQRWHAPVEARIEVIERASALLGQAGDPAALQLYAIAQSARRELAVPQPTLQVPGQRTQLRYDLPRGRVLVHSSSSDAPSWLAAALLAGNAVLASAAPSLERTLEALRHAGIPSEVLATLALDEPALVELSRHPAVDCVASDAGEAPLRALHRAMGPTPEGASGLKALLSSRDGPQPREPGFVRRFAWPRVVAVRTLRHGADLALEPGAGGNRRA
jgi:delta 1-pyrroline-5-carboxylate dehydrogenase